MSSCMDGFAMVINKNVEMFIKGLIKYLYIVIIRVNEIINNNNVFALSKSAM